MAKYPFWYKQHGLELTIVTREWCVLVVTTFLKTAINQNTCNTGPAWWEVHSTERTPRDQIKCGVLYWPNTAILETRHVTKLMCLQLSVWSAVVSVCGLNIDVTELCNAVMSEANQIIWSTGAKMQCISKPSHESHSASKWNSTSNEIQCPWNFWWNVTSEY